MTLRYSDEPVDEDFPTSPRRIRDREDREIELELAGETDLDALVDMYLTFSSADRAQGIPPSGEENIRDWLEAVMVFDSLGVIAWHRQKAVGHTMLVADDDGSYELAIFVRDEYRGSGVGTELIRTVLGAAQDHGIERVWLSVERWNAPAVALYDKMGFERMDDVGFELEMTIRIESTE